MGLGLIIQRRSHFPPRGVAGMLRNRWPEWIGMAGRNAPEWVAGMDRNQWPECVGIRRPLPFCEKSQIFLISGKAYWRNLFP